MALSAALFVIGVAILLIPPFLQRFHIDVRGGEVVVGILLAALFPAVLDAEWTVFLAELGLLVLMFEIGLDIDLQRLRDKPVQSLKYGLVSFIVPFVMGSVAAYVYTGSFLPALIIGTGLSSTSLAVLIPSMDRLNLEDDLVVNAAMVSEMTGITILMAFSRAETMGSASLFFEAASVIGFVLFAVVLVPWFFDKMEFIQSATVVEVKTKFMLFALLIISVVSEELGVHAATGAFLAGLFLSESTHKGLEIEERLGPIIELLVPVFFVHIGYLVTPALLTWEAVTIAFILAAVVYVSRQLAFTVLGDSLGLPSKPGVVALFAPCMTITATAAEIGKTTSLFSSAVFTTFIVAGLFLTIIGPLRARFADPM